MVNHTWTGLSHLKRSITPELVYHTSTCSTPLNRFITPELGNQTGSSQLHQFSTSPHKLSNAPDLVIQIWTVHFSMKNIHITTRNIRLHNIWILLYVAFCTWQYRDRRKPEAGTMPYSYFEWPQGFFIVRSTIGSTVHSMPLNSLEHCICTTTMSNIRPDRDSILVPPGYKPQSIRMSDRGRPIWLQNTRIIRW